MATETELLEALGRIASGSGPKGDLGLLLTRKVAVDTLRAAIEELIDLRQASNEFVCLQCKVVVVKKTRFKTRPSCSACKGEVVVYSHVQMQALRAKIGLLEEQIARLTEVISVAFDLDQQALEN